MATADERYRAPGEGLVSVWGCREAAEPSGVQALRLALRARSGHST